MLEGTDALIALIATVVFIILVIIGLKRLGKKFDEKVKKDQEEEERFRLKLSEKIQTNINQNNLNEVDNNGRTLLMHAIHAKLPNDARSLIENGADVNAQTNQKTTALHYACEMGYTDIVALLIQHNADTNKQDEAGYTPLMLASLQNNVEIIDQLINAGANPDLQTFKLALTALMLAVINGKAESIFALVNSGSDLQLKSKDGKSIIDISKASVGRFITPGKQDSLSYENAINLIESKYHGRKYREIKKHSVHDDYDLGSGSDGD